MDYKNEFEFAQNADQNDRFRDFRDLFYFPQLNGKDALYFTGNSLGLQTKSTAACIKQELDDWAKHGVEGHFNAKNPWFAYHEWFAKPLSKIVGALPSEVVAMNQLTVNLHLLMVSFYRPTPRKFKILCEARAFPSDQYALESQVRFHGFAPEDAIIEIVPRPGEYCIREEDILEAIDTHADELALVLMGGVNYVTGQFFNLEKITHAGHLVNALVGFDLAHAAGNVPLMLHDWDVDFACWCSYKYLNSGPGGVGGVFVHEKHHQLDWPRFAGWWGHNKQERFKMEKHFKPIESAEAWQMSNAPVISMAAHRAALEVFEKTEMSLLRAKSLQLTGFMEFLILETEQQLREKGFHHKSLEIITPRDTAHRGCQLSVVANGFGKALHQDLINQGVISDWREPNVIRFAPVPLYNSFKDVFEFGKILQRIVLSN
jgi:kynureninase